MHDKPSSAINNRIFNLVLEKLDVRDFSFHDLRRTQASWHAQTGATLMV
jgi:integrase